MRTPVSKLRRLLTGAVLALAVAVPAGAEVALGGLRQLPASEVAVQVLSKFYNRRTRTRTYQVTLTNVSDRALSGSVIVVVDAISPAGVTVVNQSDVTDSGLPLLVFLEDGVLEPGAALVEDVEFFGSGYAQVGFTALPYLEELVLDGTAPDLDASVARYTTADAVTVTGSATDEGSGIASVTITADTAPASPVAAVVQADGAFTVSVPVVLGDNVLTVRAEDGAGNSASGQRLTTRVEQPAVVILGPGAGERIEADAVTVGGEIRTELPADTLALSFRDRLLQPAPPATAGVVPFTFADALLVPGTNRLTVVLDSPVGRVADSVDVERVLPPDADDDTAPTLAIERPLPGAFVADDVVVVTGRATDAGAVAAVSVAGEAASTSGADARDVSYRYAYDLSGVSGPVVIPVTATDAAGNTTAAEVEIERDAQPPVLDVTGLAPAPAVNVVVAVPYRLEGTVVDANLAALRVNGRAVGLTPGTAANDYGFAADVVLVPGQVQSVNVEARDLAGNATTLEYRLRADAVASVEILAPRDGAELLVSGDGARIDLVARVSALPDGATLHALVDGVETGAVELDGGVAVAAIDLPAVDGARVLELRVDDAAGVVLRRASVGVVLVSQDALPVDLVRHVPENGGVDARVSDPVTLHFNKPVDLDELEVVVRETFHGLTYAAPPEDPSDFASSTAALVEIHRDRVLVPVRAAPLPGSQMVSYYAERDFAFGATVYVEVFYEGFPLGRFSYEVQPRPTFVQGLVADQLLVPLAGLEVTMPDLGLATTTDANGAFNLGSGAPGVPQIAPGRQRLVFNAGLANRAFGTLEIWANVQAGRLTNVGLTRLPILNPDVPFQRIESGAPRVLLAGGDLELGLAGAELRFPGGRDEGDVHVQFTGLNEIPVPIAPGAMPHWVFAVQPTGVAVSGAPTLALDMPALYGSRDYVPDDGTHVVLLGLHPRARELVPVGVGTVTAARVESVAPLALERLDFLGYALVGPELQDTLADFAAGSIGLDALTAALEAR